MSLVLLQFGMHLSFQLAPVTSAGVHALYMCSLPQAVRSCGSVRASKVRCARALAGSDDFRALSPLRDGPKRAATARHRRLRRIARQSGARGSPRPQSAPTAARAAAARLRRPRLLRQPLLQRQQTAATCRATSQVTACRWLRCAPLLPATRPHLPRGDRCRPRRGAAVRAADDDAAGVRGHQARDAGRGREALLRETCWRAAAARWASATRRRWTRCTT